MLLEDGNLTTGNQVLTFVIESFVKFSIHHQIPDECHYVIQWLFVICTYATMQLGSLCICWVHSHQFERVVVRLSKWNIAWRVYTQLDYIQVIQI